MTYERPIVSVVLPTYNRLNYLREAVASVLAQTYDRWELIVVDDGSTDRTVEYLRTLPRHRVQIVRRTHRSNAAIARNLGLAHARGDYVAFLDSDDVWLPDKLTLQVHRLRAMPDARWSYTQFGIINDRGDDIPVLSGGPWYPHEGWVLEKVITTEVIAPMPTLVVDQRFLRELGGFDERLVHGQDLDLRLRLAARSPVCAVPRTLCKIREHAGRSTYMLQEIHLWWLRVYEKFGRSAATKVLRRSCRRECAFHLAYLGDHYAKTTSLWRAAPLLFAAFTYRPLYPWLWRVTAKAMIRPLVPAAVWHALRGQRRRRQAAPPSHDS